MEKKHEDDPKVSEENSMANSDQIPTTFSPFSGILNLPSTEINTSVSPGFTTDILEIQDYSTPSLFNMFQTPPPPPETASTSGNSTSISSSSTEVTNDAQSAKTTAAEDQDRDKNINKPELKPKKQNTKSRPRQPRFAFMTKSDVDHLDDGYRWRKYGQKAVKNSPFPRSYYRCTTTSCGVKKRVERSSQDSSIVVTTYEGTHTHQCPVTPRGNIGPIVPEMATRVSPNLVISQPYNNHHFYDPHNNVHPLPIFSTPQLPFDLSTNYNNPNSTTSNNPYSSDYIHQKRLYYPPSPSSPSSSSSASLSVRNSGLLQDVIMPSQVCREEPKDDHEL